MIKKLHWNDHINNIKSKANKRLYLVRKLGQFKVDRTLITLFYKSVIESVLSFCITCWGGNSSKGDRIKLDRIIKISENSQPMFLIWMNYTIKRPLIKLYPSQKM